MSHTSRPKKNRLLLDVTIAATTELNTGIQRVVRNVCRYADSVSQDLDVECVPIVCYGDQISAVGFDGRARIDERIMRGLQRGWTGMHEGIATRLSGLKKGAGRKYLSLLSRLRKLMIPKTLVRGTGNFYRRVTGQTIQFQENDVLVLLDASWDLPLERLLAQAREKHVPVVTVVYDLIPLLYPEFHPPQLKAVFARWFEMVLAQSDMMIGISKTVRDDVAQFIKRRESDADLPFSTRVRRLESFRLGSDFCQVASVTSAVEEDGLRQQVDPQTTGLKHGNFFLSVGTIEPRKNHAFTIDAFEQLWRTGSKSQLVIVGKVGWMCDEVVERIQQHPELNRNLFLIENASDELLTQLYQGARALVFPSIVEGFGLPIVEAFQHRLPALVSDTRIHREVAGENGIYFSLDDPGELASIVERIETCELTLIKPEPPATSWKDSCFELLNKVTEFLGSDQTTTAPDHDTPRVKEAA